MLKVMLGHVYDKKKVIKNFWKILDIQLKTGEITYDEYMVIAKRAATGKMKFADVEWYVIKYNINCLKK